MENIKTLPQVLEVKQFFFFFQERPRPTFAALAPTVARNPVTGIMEPHFPEQRRTHRVFSGIAVVLTMVSLVLVFMVGVIVYKLLVYRPLAKNPSTKAKAQQIANMTGAMVNLMTIMILSRVRRDCSFLTSSNMSDTATVCQMVVR